MSNKRTTASDGPGPDERTTAEATAGLPAVPVREISHAPGTMIGAYKVLEVLGEGGFGVVYLAEQSQPVRRRVALKIIKPGMDSRAIVARFEAERQALALMSHPNIAKVLDAGTTPLELPGGGRPYFAMEHIKGTPITEYCDTHRLTVEQRLKLFAVVCEAVQHAHMKGIIHRDLKPSNILVTIAEGAEPRPVVIDFGVAKALAGRLGEQSIYTERGMLIGTPEYMSPEQAEMSEADIDTRSDVYSLGVLLYELLTGTVPFDSKAFRAAGVAAIQKMIRETDPPRPSTRLSAMGEETAAIAAARQTALSDLAAQLRRELEWIPLKALRKDRSERYRSASELADDVRNYLAQRPLIAGPETTGYRVRKFAKRNKGAVAAGGAIAAALLLAVGVLAWSQVRVSAALRKESLARAEAEKQTEIARVNAIEAKTQATLAVSNAEKESKERTRADDANAFNACARFYLARSRSYPPESTVYIYGPLTPAASRHISRLPEIDRLDFDKNIEDVDTIIKLVASRHSPFRSLKVLDISGSNATDMGMKYLSHPDTGLPFLKALFISEAKVTDEGLAALANADTSLSVLEILDIGGNIFTPNESTVTDAGLAALARSDTGLKALRRLYLRGANITDSGLENLARADTGLQSLVFLDLNSTQVTDAGVTHLAATETGLKYLEGLVLTGTSVSDAGVMSMCRSGTGLKALNSLVLTNTRITDASLEAIALPNTGLKMLRALDIYSIRITIIGIQSMSRDDTGLKVLSKLSIGNTELTDEGLKTIAHSSSGLRSLTNLDLSRTPITDVGIVALARADTGLTKLATLNLSDTKVSDNGLHVLTHAESGLKDLSWLDLSRTQVTDSGVAAVKSRLPNVKVFH